MTSRSQPWGSEYMVRPSPKTGGESCRGRLGRGGCRWLVPSAPSLVIQEEEICGSGASDCTSDVSVKYIPDVCTTQVMKLYFPQPDPASQNGPDRSCTLPFSSSGSEAHYVTAVTKHQCALSTPCAERCLGNLHWFFILILDDLLMYLWGSFVF